MRRSGPRSASLPQRRGVSSEKWALEFSEFRFFPSVDVHTLPLPSLFFSFLTSPQCFLRRPSGSRTAGHREASRESAALGLPLGQKTCSKTAAAMAIRATCSRINTPDNTRRGLRPLPGKTQCPVHVQPIQPCPTVRGKGEGEAPPCQLGSSWVAAGGAGWG